MPVTVRVRNFQSIEDATVVLDGFTVITGPNNSGKTSFMRAFRGVFLNSPPGSIVRRGTAHLTVTIDFGDGNTVKWEKGWEKPEKKGKTVNRYHVNGKMLADVGRGCPPEVLAMGMNPIKAGSGDVWPQIADQFKGVLFLVGSPGSSMAEAIANVDKVGKLAAALKLSEQERRSITSKLKVRRGDEKVLAAEVEAFTGIDDVAVQILAIETAVSEAGILFTEYAVAKSLSKRWKVAHGEVLTLKGINDVEFPPDPSNIVVDRDNLADLIKIHSTIDRRRTEVELLSGIVGVAIPSDPSGIEVDRDQLTGLTRIRNTLKYRRTEVEDLSGIETVTVPDAEAATASLTARGRLADLRRLHTRLKAAQATMATMEGYDDLELPDTARVNKVQGVVTFFKGIQGRRNTALSNIEALEEALRLAGVEQETSEQGVTDQLGELGECPICGTVTTDGKHIHEEAA